MPVPYSFFFLSGGAQLSRDSARWFVIASRGEVDRNNANFSLLNLVVRVGN